ncbi:Asp-tRNA(Asn)/Glu-tRNA(Gln) amidotransferase subunit GatA [Mucilaginibacter pallidiroseus]|uniref:Glutamyl-tRNA(Gln) amidotransferase subunit A n=1 Tax=Mucilaginibacter pallidiroseus TaxID=2599295 RepID=A0A563UGS2_9SPHI|nr:Asp-tRNA(Asn)/Glu-tRNA(Gln) amidotransferase subunit GatA [Mucilaginibacter pallidiroseus]TWR30493.1 Asp-tRNA(Asn)/Glu-tRNA(Gln) amidotransferase subunit GatA [Mucilaginibacter pallidiroseus]
MSINYASYKDLKRGLQNGDVTATGLVKGYLQQIEANARLNVFNEVFEQSALAKAADVDARIQNGTVGRLAGMVIGIKDNICYKGHKVSASSKILEDFTSVYSATIVERLLAEDAIIIGRCNCDEFAMGAANETSYFGPVKNYADETRVSGGSSGGSAVAVQANMCHAAIGTDTGGSVRQPASFCGLVGLKPTYGRISRNGIISYASSFDQVGTLTKSVYDAALLLEIMAGADDFDGTLSQKAVPAYAAEIAAPGKKKIAYLQEAISSPGVDPEVKNALITSIEKLRAEGHTVKPVSFELLDYLVPSYYILATAEASSNLARYDGVHYGYRSPNATDLTSTYKLSRSEGFGKEVKRRIMLGTFVLSAGYYDAYYAKAQKVRRLIRQKTNELLAEYDFILTPTAPEPAFELGKTEKDPVVTYLYDIFTVQASLAGLPAISVPAGNNSKGLPLGLQFLTRAFSEQELLNFSEYFLQL